MFYRPSHQTVSYPVSVALWWNGHELNDATTHRLRISRFGSQGGWGEKENLARAVGGGRRGGGVGWLKGKQERGSSLACTPFLLLG